MERTQEYQDERWKERARQIRDLDGHKCAMCGAKGELHVHHLAYPPAPFHIWDCRDDELVTLCPECHKKVHTAISRVYLDEHRIVCGYVTDEEIDRQIREHFRSKWKAAKESGEICCAKCKFVEVLDDMGCCCILGRGFCPTEPEQKACEHFEYHEDFVARFCGNCEHFTPYKEDESGYGYCNECLHKGEPMGTYSSESGVTMICGGHCWKLKNK